jgi:prolyl oligopeptidase PreP (S9A serine peptidase family)
MKKVIKIGFPIICIAVIGGTFYLLNKTLNKVNANKVTENTVNEDINETTNISSPTDEEDLENIQTITSTILVEEQENNAAKEIQKKAEAIELVKVADGTRSSKVYYTNEGMDDDRYIVAVRYEDTTEAIIYYTVDVEKENVEIYY